MHHSLFISCLNALGNRYLLFDCSRSFPTHAIPPQLAPEWVQRMCRLEKTDGLLYGPLPILTQMKGNADTIPSVRNVKATPISNQSFFGLIIYNSDGSIAEKSGNGLRIFACYLKKHFFFPESTLQIDLLAYRFSASEPKARMEKISASQADFSGSEIGIHLPSPKIQRAPNSDDVEPVKGDEGFAGNSAQVSYRERICRGFWAELAGMKRIPVALSRDRYGNEKIASVFQVDIGNPHCVLLCEKKNFSTSWAEKLIRKVGPFFETLPCFPNRSNVQFVSLLSAQEIEVHVWERGSGYTLSSGTSAAAAFFVCRYRNLVEKSVIARMPGGNLTLAHSSNIDKEEVIIVRGSVLPEYFNREYLYPLEKISVV